jgi:putative endonuclease
VKWRVYVLYSYTFQRRYVGLSSNPERRLQEHNSGKTKSTRAYKPWKLIYSEEFYSRKIARDREKYLKSGAGREFLDNLLDP